MGTSYSYLEIEKESWIDHLIKFDTEVRDGNLSILDQIKNGNTIYLAFTKSCWGQLEHEHWFVTDGTYYIEYGSKDSDLYKAAVTINTNKREFQKDSFTIEMCNEIRERALLILGMNNYSLALRNSEHVANYIVRNRWYSSQMVENKGKLYKYFEKHLLDHKKKVNTFPSCVKITNKDANTKIYSFFGNSFQFTKSSLYLDKAEDNYNILVIGPTGGGKSNLINVLFNKNVCHSETSLFSVTRDVCFIKGRADVYDESNKVTITKDVIVADTVGLCDSNWSNTQTLEFLKSRVKESCVYIDVVFIVLRCNVPLSKQHKKSMMEILKWLNYTKNSPRFRFVATHGDQINNEDKEKLISQIKEVLGIKKSTLLEYENIAFDSIIFTSFPSEIDTDKKRESVIKSHSDILVACKFSGKGERIVTTKNNYCTLL